MNVIMICVRLKLELSNAVVYMPFVMSINDQYQKEIVNYHQIKLVVNGLLLNGLVLDIFFFFFLNNSVGLFLFIILNKYSA